MSYFILGEDRTLKDQKITELKKKFIVSSDILVFDHDVLDAQKLSAENLKKTLLALPTLASHRLVIIHNVHKLDAQNQKIIQDFFKAKNVKTVLILESQTLKPQDSFVKSLGSAVHVIHCALPQPLNVFDMTKAMGLRRADEALKILYQLVSDGNHPLQIMGGLSWYWGKCRERVSRLKFQKGLSVLQEADLNIKRSRLKPEQAVEVAVVKLCGLL